jgi:hypothetical protein
MRDDYAFKPFGGHKGFLLLEGVVAVLLKLIICWFSIKACWEGLGLSGFGADWERLGRLPSDVKVLMAVEMSDFALEVCAAGVRAQNPKISNAELMEKLRERLNWSKSMGRQRQQRKRGV